MNQLSNKNNNDNDKLSRNDDDDSYAEPIRMIKKSVNEDKHMNIDNIKVNKEISNTLDCPISKSNDLKFIT